MSEEREIPIGWTDITISELISSDGVFVDGDWIESKDQDPNGSVRLIQLADIGDGEFKNKSNRFLTIERAKELNCTFLKEGDILVARMPDPIGRACIFPLKGDEKFITAVDVAIIRLGHNSIENKFLVHSINNRKIRNEIENLQSGTTRKRISRANLATIKFPLPPLPEQHRIVAKIEELFSSLDKGIESLKTAEQQLKVYRQAVLKWAFEGKLTNKDVQEGELPEGWEWKTIKEIGKVKGGKRLPKGHTYSEEKTNFPYLRVTDFENLTIKQEKLKYLFPETQKHIKNYIISKNDVFISIAGTIGQVGVIPENLDGANLTENAAKITELKEVYNKYLANYLASKTAQTQIVEHTIATTQPKLSLFRIEKINVPIPPTQSEQQLIVSEIESRLSVCDKIEESISTSLQQAEALRQSILKKAFEGKLVPQDPNDEPASVLLERIKAERETNKPVKKAKEKKVKQSKSKNTVTA